MPGTDGQAHQGILFLTYHMGGLRGRLYLSCLETKLPITNICVASGIYLQIITEADLCVFLTPMSSSLNTEVLREVARHAYADNLTDCYIDIPKQLAPGPKATMRCCIYKERAILQERIKLAMGGHEDKPNVIEVIPIACDECPISRYEVGVDCRGCIAHRCQAACPAGAIFV